MLWIHLNIKAFNWPSLAYDNITLDFFGFFPFRYWFVYWYSGCHPSFLFDPPHLWVRFDFLVHADFLVIAFETHPGWSHWKCKCSAESWIAKGVCEESLSPGTEIHSWKGRKQDSFSYCKVQAPFVCRRAAGPRTGRTIYTLSFFPLDPSLLFFLKTEVSRGSRA